MLAERSRVERAIELCYIRFDVADGLRQALSGPPAT
jgi:hypothetical protein